MEEAKEMEFDFKCFEDYKTGDYKEEVIEEDNQSMPGRVNFAVVTLQDTDEVMVVASDWLSTDQKQCYWPPFKSTEKYMEAVKKNLEPSTGWKPWEKLNVIFHAKFDTYEEAVNYQVEQRALKKGQILYKVVTLHKSNELTVIPTTWLNEERTQCYWPPFKSPEKCTEAVMYRHDPPVTVQKPWELLNIQVHMECVTYKQAKKMQKSLKERAERSLLPPAITYTLPHIFPHGHLRLKAVKHPGLVASSVQSSYTYSPKRKRLSESSASSITSAQPSMTTGSSTVEMVRQVMEQVHEKVQATNQDVITTYVGDAISKMDKICDNKKITIGVFGKSGQGKSSLLNAILGRRNLLPSGCFGACTSVVTQVQANLKNTNYIAEIELFSKEEWEKELNDVFRALLDKDQDRDEDLETKVEKITALYGADADKKTLEELKKDDKYAEIEKVLSVSKKAISNSDVSAFANDVASYIQHSESSTGHCYWPLVKSVRIQIPDCRELLEHIELLDLPGTGHCNNIRNDPWKT